MPTRLNVVGNQVRLLREQAELTQEQLAAKCQVIGLDITRGTLAKIESEKRSVYDHEIPFLALALGVQLPELFPTKPESLKRKIRNPAGSRRSKG